LKPYADHFSRLAPAYAECRPGYPDELFDYLAGLVNRHELAWDCGAGTGQASLPLTRVFHRVIATDASAAMLHQAPRHPKIEYRTVPAESSGLGSGTADLVTVAQALHWLNTSLFYAEAERVLAPGGVLAVWTYGSQHLGHELLDAALQQFYHHVVGPYWPPERRHVDSGYRTLPFPFPELPVPSFEMQAHWTLEQLLGYVGTWSATQRCREVLGSDPVAKLREQLARHWGEAGTVRSITWPVSLRVGRRL
jgi:SAM-dependent methyltransferase